MAIIYKTTNLINGKIYIGVHNEKNPGYLGSGEKLKRAISKYGKENFTRETIESFSTLEEAYQKESFYIEHYNSRDNNVGYNIHPGGNGSTSYVCSCERKQAISEGIQKAIKEKNLKPWNKDKKMSQEFKDAVSNGMKNTPGAIRYGKDNIFGQVNWSGSDNGNAKVYIVISPEGIQHTIRGEMNKFCVENNLSLSGFHYTKKTGKPASKRSKNYGWEVIWPE